ncbi:MAG: WbqC family protein [Rikenellaceae bacterium]|jgi:hypothetical protein|nr:WbqC family protein [Rikenellaceae bacterium]
MTILPLTYLGNIQWFTKLLFEECVIDLGEHYVRQSYRNRCEILASGGVVPLSAQVVKPDNWNRQTMAEVRLDYSKRWQHRHWNSIVAAYRSSPWFDHYAPLLEPFYRRRFELLSEFNMELLHLMLKLLNASPGLRFSREYIPPAEGDLRAVLSPKARRAKPDPRFAPAEYWQVFSDRHPFAPNLSIIDLLFCEGPRAMEILRAGYL